MANSVLKNTMASAASTALISSITIITGVKINNSLDKLFTSLEKEVYPKKRFGIFKVKPKKK